MSKLLTISIAAYNVEKTIRECLDSFLPCHHLNDLEILVINDGSHDRTAEIVAEYERKYPNSVRLINKENGGHGSTLNKSLELATGKFYKAVDGDDWVDADELDKLCNWLEKTDADLVIDDYREVYPNHCRLISLREKYTLGKIYQFDELFVDRGFENYLFVMSNSTIKTVQLRKVKMKIQENCFYADTELYFFIGLAAEKITFVDSCTYQYRLGNNGQSVSANGYYRHIEDLIKIELNLMNLYAKYGPFIKSNIRREYLFSIVETRYIMLFECYTKIISREDKDFLFANFLETTEKQYPTLLRKINFSFADKYIIGNPMKRIPQIRHFRKTWMFQFMRTVKHLLSSIKQN